MVFVWITSIKELDTTENILEITLTAHYPPTPPSTGDHEKDIAQLQKTNARRDDWRKLHIGSATLTQGI